METKHPVDLELFFTRHEATKEAIVIANKLYNERRN